MSIREKYPILDILYRIISGDTKAELVTGPSRDVVFDADLTEQIRERLGDNEEEFVIHSERTGKSYRVKTSAAQG